MTAAEDVPGTPTMLTELIQASERIRRARQETPGIVGSAEVITALRPALEAAGIPPERIIASPCVPPGRVYVVGAPVWRAES